jgi:hypothetical protein
MQLAPVKMRSVALAAQIRSLSFFDQSAARRRARTNRQTTAGFASTAGAEAATALRLVAALDNGEQAGKPSPAPGACCPKPS